MIAGLASSGHLFSFTVVLSLVAVAQWIVFAIASLVSQEYIPDEGLRAPDRNLAISSVVFVALWIVAFSHSAGAATEKTKVAEASAVTGSQQGSCSSVDVGMTASTVRRKIGEPNEKRSDEDVRGPTATMWIYRGSRCVVHMFEDRVEFVE